MARNYWASCRRGSMFSSRLHPSLTSKEQSHSTLYQAKSMVWSTSPHSSLLRTSAKMLLTFLVINSSGDWCWPSWTIFPRDSIFNCTSCNHKSYVSTRTRDRGLAFLASPLTKWWLRPNDSYDPMECCFHGSTDKCEMPQRNKPI